MSDAERQRAYRIAGQARRYSMLAERPELLYPEPTMRAKRLISNDTRPPLDVMLLGGVDELDRLCAAAVAALSSDAPMAKPVLSLLGVLPADYLIAIYFALPVKRRGQCETDAVWAYHLRRVPEDVGEAISSLAGLAEAEAECPEAILNPDEAAEYRQFTQGLLRRALGMAGDMDDEHEALAVAGERAIAAAMDGGNGGPARA